MWFFRAPLWQQLGVVWGLAVTLAAVLLVLDRREPSNFFWLVPYPASFGVVRQIVVEAFRARPVFASAVLLVPAAAVLATAGLACARLVGLMRTLAPPE